MYIQNLQIINFRNYENEKIIPSKGLNVITGLNAQGKSAILEAIYLLATSKSHRTSKDMDMIKIGQNFSRVVAKIERTQRNEVELEIILSKKDKKTVKIDEVKHPKIGDIIGQLNAVIFSSSDIEMVKGEPSLRRRFLNLEISQISPQYVYTFSRYKRSLEQRNNLLKEIKFDYSKIEGLDVWDTQLAVLGSQIIIKRDFFIRNLSKEASFIYNSLTQGDEELKISYNSNPEIPENIPSDEIQNYLLKMIKARRDLDLSRGTTSCGPHRDDMKIQINGISAKDFASSGQQRTAAVAIKLAEIKLMEESCNEIPVVLLDDVMAELDEIRRKKVMEFTLGKCQTLITTTEIDDLDESLLENAVVFDVKSGKVSVVK